MPAPVTLKFIFANHDQRVAVEIPTDLSARVADVKRCATEQPTLVVQLHGLTT